MVFRCRLFLTGIFLSVPHGKKTFVCRQDGNIFLPARRQTYRTTIAGNFLDTLQPKRYIDFMFMKLLTLKYYLTYEKLRLLLCRCDYLLRHCVFLAVFA